MLINPQKSEIDPEISQFFQEICSEKLESLIRSPGPDLYKDFYLDLTRFFDDFPIYFPIFYEKPREILLLLENSLLEAQKILFSLRQKEGKFEYSVKEFLNIRLKNVPYCRSIYRYSLSEIDESSLDKFLVVQATIIRVGGRKSLEKKKLFKCVQCNTQYLCQADIEDFNKLQVPFKCLAKVSKPKKDNPISILFDAIKKKKAANHAENSQNLEVNQKMKEEICGGRKFEPLENTQNWVDYQEIKVQETFQTVKPGCIPKTMWVILESTLVDTCKPGDDVVISGVLTKRWKKITLNTRPDISLCILANEISIKNKENAHGNPTDSIDKELLSYEEEMEINWLQCQGDFSLENDLRNTIIQSVCPQIYQKFDIKLAILLTVIGGLTQNLANTQVRGQCHLLLLGEPGTGKSQMLKFAQGLSPRAIFTNGIGSSSAGLTLSFIREGGDWMVEAGALVLSDHGICCIDEFNLIKSTDFVAIHEAMEQQTISAAKAGLTIKVNARTTILAACNPISPGQRYDAEKTLVDNTGLTSPLISRFDLVFVMKDEIDSEMDLKNCDFILMKFQKGYLETIEEKELWDVEILRKYIQMVQRKFEPVLSQIAQTILMKYYYNHLRKLELQGKTTIRALESLVRLSQAHARLMFKGEVGAFDAVCVIILMECAFFTGFLDNLNVKDFILLDEEKFDFIQKTIMEKLGLSEEN